MNARNEVRSPEVNHVAEAPALEAVREITDRRAAQGSEDRLAAIVASSDDAIFATTIDGEVTSWNTAAVRLYGYSVAEMIGRPMSLLATSAKGAERQAEMREQVAEDVPCRVETSRRRKDGVVIQLSIAASAIHDAFGEVAGISYIAHDTTERTEMIRDLNLKARLLDAVDVAVIATDMSGEVVYWSAGAEQLYGWTAAEVLGRPILTLTVGPEDTSVAQEIMEEITERGGWEGNFTVTRKDGTRFPALVRNVIFSDQEGHDAGVIGVSTDITDRLAAEHELSAARDTLAAVTENIAEGLLLIDTEGRITYVNGVMSAMVGREEQALLGSKVTELFDVPDEAMAGLLSMLQPSSERVTVDTESMLRKGGGVVPVEVTSSAASPSGEPNAQWAMVVGDDTVRRAAFAALQSKLESAGWVGRLGAALREGTFELYAQPIVEIAGGELLCHELLIRMQAADGSIIPPDRFLPAAEEHGLIGEIDRWVVDRGIELAARGHPVSINLSAVTIAQPNTGDWIADQIRDSKADPSLLVFELTETALLENIEPARLLSSSLTELGSLVALDDFGSGYGAFTYLKELDHALLKIHRDFISDLTEDKASRHLVKGVVGLAHAFELRTVAEGVEDKHTLEVLESLGVDLAQGFHIARPAPVAEVLGDPESAPSV